MMILPEHSNTLQFFIENGLLKPDQPLRLHLGCGEKYLEGYINIDYSPQEHTLQSHAVADVFADITTLAFPPQTVDEIRMHHVFEHFERATALALLLNWQSWLKLGGVLHIETPDILGCARLLTSRASYSVKQAVLRHAFGSHEAAWAYHYDGWYADKYQYILGGLGFTVTCRPWQWTQPPFLPNVDVLAEKRRSLELVPALAFVDLVLRDSLVVEVAEEYKLQQVWRQKILHRLKESWQRLEPSAPFPLDSRLAHLPVYSEAAQLAGRGYDQCDLQVNGEANLLHHLLQDGDMIFDVGANRGLWSALVLSRVHPAQIHAFEPIPQSFCVLQEKLAAQPVCLNQSAVTDQTGKRIIHHYYNDPASAEMSGFHRRLEVEQRLNLQVAALEVDTVSLDDYCRQRQITWIDFVKIDVEGVEFDVLTGARNLLSNHQIGFLQFEYGGTYRDAGFRLYQVCQYLSEWDYVLFRILPDGLMHLPEWTASYENYRYSNYLAVAPLQARGWTAMHMTPEVMPARPPRPSVSQTLVQTCVRMGRAVYRRLKRVIRR